MNIFTDKLIPFRFWCQKVLPLVYDESLSYYEVLEKTVYKLNEIINALGEIPSYVEGAIGDAVTGLNNEIEQVSNNVDTLSAHIDAIDELCNQILTIISESDVNPNIGYVQNQTIDTDMLNVMYNAMQSYQLEAWDIAGHNITYGNYLTNNPLGTGGTPVDPDGSYTVCDKFDCSSFVLLSLMGIDYHSTPMTGHRKTVNMRPRTNFSRQYKYKERRNPDSKLRWASDIYEMAESEQMLFKISNDYSNLRTGDVVFWKYKDEVWDSLADDSFAKADGGAYKHVAHTGIIVQDATAFESNIGLMHCVNTEANMAFQDFTTYNPTTIELMPYAMRPWKYRVTGNPEFNGFACLRKINTSNKYIPEYKYSIEGNVYSFSGGQIQSDYSEYGLDLNTGAEDTSLTGRITTPFIPFSPAIVFELDEPSIKRRYFYYDGAGNFLQSTADTMLRPNVNARLMKIVLYNPSNTGGALTEVQKEYALSHAIIRFHIMSDSLASKQSGTNGNSDCDTFYFFTANKEFKSVTEI